MVIKDLLKGYEGFLEEYLLEENKSYLEKAVITQNPEIFLIRCCDSRIEPTILTKAPLGKFFTFSCLANLVPRYNSGTMKHEAIVAALYMAVVELKIKNIIILGHSNCQGCLRINSPNLENKLYLQYLVGYKVDINKIISEATTLVKEKNLQREYIEKAMLKVSLKNLETYNFIQEQLLQGLKIYGWYFNISNGNIEVYNDTIKTFMPIKEFYR